MISMGLVIILAAGLMLLLVIAGIVMVVISARNNEIREPTPPLAAPPSPANPQEEVRSLVNSGQKIEAIKAYRMATGVGLKEAKDAVEALEQGGLWSPPATAPLTSPPVDLQSQLLELIHQNNKIGAVKRYREATGVGLKEALDAVEALERGAAWSEPASTALPVQSVDLEMQVLDLLRQERKIEAIKVYREHTGLGLKEAKNAVEALERKLP